MTATIGVRREDKSEWERRVPVIPQDAADLQRAGVRVIVESSDTRAYRDDEFAEMGISVQSDLKEAPVILGIKEIPPRLFDPGKTYIFFAHVIKGQPYNMPMLRRLLDLGCTLIDYERVVDDKNRRLIFFGWHAGVSGMIDTLWALGQRLAWEGISNPFEAVRQTHTYHDLAEVNTALRGVADAIRRDGLPGELVPLVFGFAGYGNVSRGAQEMLDLLPVVEIAPEELSGLVTDARHSRHCVYKVVFKEEHMVTPRSAEATFALQDYYDHPEKYDGVFEKYLPYLTVLVNAIFWTPDYPRLVTKAGLERLFAEAARPRLRVIGDISCDVEGAIEVTVKATEPGNPIYVYDPATGQVQDGSTGPGVVIMAVEILPAELPRESSAYFSGVLKPFLPAIARCDFSVPFEASALPPEIKRAVIAYRGELTPDYRYITRYLDAADD
ncbi:MAG TPA: bifunctional lysine ketoglutarate reductase /saccharopine dehydrogenase family protein [Anaerolineae bacterium]|nr:bifunctional lysine ketoglutarate reductase /saccharopine dehydrogenase family protein [Anaerolineae bacterium]